MASRGLVYYSRNIRTSATCWPYSVRFTNPQCFFSFHRWNCWNNIIHNNQKQWTYFKKISDIVRFFSLMFTIHCIAAIKCNSMDSMNFDNFLTLWMLTVFDFIPFTVIIIIIIIVIHSKKSQKNRSSNHWIDYYERVHSWLHFILKWMTTKQLRDNTRKEEKKRHVKHAINAVFILSIIQSSINKLSYDIAKLKTMAKEK